MHSVSTSSDQRSQRLSETLKLLQKTYAATHFKVSIEIACVIQRSYHFFDSEYLQLWVMLVFKVNFQTFLVVRLLLPY